ncbi:Uncharacterised protein [Mycobacterium tuberculosis]|nr:Uncharacterised protein [Mycobacterium tuberculosis]
MPLSVFGHSSDSFCPTPGAVRTTYTESAIDPSGGGGGLAVFVASGRRGAAGVSVAGATRAT